MDKPENESVELACPACRGTGQETKTEIDIGKYSSSIVLKRVGTCKRCHGRGKLTYWPEHIIEKLRRDSSNRD